MKKSTMQDVADLAGVSQASVSLILNNNDKITFSNETKERVFEAARKLDYSLPRRKHKKSSSQSKMLLVLVPTLTNQYYSELVQFLEGYADRLGYRVILCNTFRRPDLEKFYLDTFLSDSLEGVIYAFLPSFPRLVEQISKTLPVVIIGEKHEDLSICSIELSNITAGSMLAEHLYQLGHRNFAFFSTPFNHLTMARSQRLEGIKSQLKSHGLGESSLQVIVEDEKREAESQEDAQPYEFEVGRRLCRKFLTENKSNATALIAVNDMTAIGIMHELKCEHYNIPEDYSVAGFDNIFSSGITTPGLTTIDHHLQRRCRSAVDMILEMNTVTEDKKQSYLNKIEYTPYLVNRGSTGKAKAKQKTN